MVHDATRGCHNNVTKLTRRNKLLVHFSMSLIPTSNLGEITPTLFNLPVKF